MIGWRSRSASRSEARSASLPTPLRRGHEWPPELDEDADLRSAIATLAPRERRELREVLTLPEPQRNALLHALLPRAGAEPLCQLIAITDADRVAQLRVLRAIRDVG